MFHIKSFINSYLQPKPSILTGYITCVSIINTTPFSRLYFDVPFIDFKTDTNNMTSKKHSLSNITGRELDTIIDYCNNKIPVKIEIKRSYIGNSYNGFILFPSYVYKIIASDGKIIDIDI